MCVHISKKHFTWRELVNLQQFNEVSLTHTNTHPPPHESSSDRQTDGRVITSTKVSTSEFNEGVNVACTHTHAHKHTNTTTMQLERQDKCVPDSHKNFYECSIRVMM